MPAGKEKYQAEHNGGGQESSEAGKKTAKVAAKAAADYFTGGKGGAVVDKLADTKLGNQVLDKAGKMIDKNPALNKAAQKLNDSGALDAADKGLSMMESGGAAGSGTQGMGGMGNDTISSMGGKSDSLLGGGASSSLDSKSNIDNNEGDTTSNFEGSASFGGFGDLFGLIPGIPNKKMIMFGCGAALFFIFGFIAVISGSDISGTDPSELHAKDKDNLTSAGYGACIYNIEGFRSGSTTIVKKMEISNLKVRLMECGSPYGNGSYTKPLNEDLIEFETYVAGVANAEIGGSTPAEAIKAQMVAARSYALARPTMMNNYLGKKLEQENGQWILQISSCVADQVFCNIDQGCSYMGGGDGQGGIVRSGTVQGAIRTRTPLAADHILRTLAQEVKGQVLVDKNNYIISAGYTSTEQNIFINLANSGLNYKQILLQVYNQGKRNSGAADIKQMDCSISNSGGQSTGPYANWKQFGSSWSNIILGNSNKTIGSSGCLVTSIAMLVAKSGVPTNVNGEFNPGTFVQKLNAIGGFSGANFIWAKVSEAASNFIYQNKVSVSGLSKEEKLNQINNLLNNGYYVVAEVKGNTGQHWVAIDSVSGATVNMMDPGSHSTDLWGQYSWGNTSTLAYFKVG